MNKLDLTIKILIRQGEHERTPRSSFVRLAIWMWAMMAGGGLFIVGLDMSFILAMLIALPVFMIGGYFMK